MEFRTRVWAVAVSVALGLAATPAVAAHPHGFARGSDQYRDGPGVSAQRDQADVSPPSYKYLTAVSALSPDDVWAVGDIWTDNGDRTLIQHFDGIVWTRYPSPNPGTYNDLYGVTAFAPDNVWAVGAIDRDGSEHPLILHWDGSAWSQVDTAISDYVDSGLYAIVGVSPTDMWVVGRRYSGPMIVHWDGTSWSQQEADNGGYDILEFDAITAISPNRLWLIGNGQFDEEQGPDGAMAQWWNGTDWTVEYRGGRPGWFSRVYFRDVSASSRKDVWVGGSFTSGVPLALHWNGARWTRPKGFPTDQGFVGAIADQGLDDVWMVGGHDQHSAIWHYDGATWTTSMSGPTGNLEDIDTTSANDVWAVGVVGTYPGGRCLIEHWDGTDWTATTNCAGYRHS